MEKLTTEFKNQIKINPDNLEAEFLKQPSLFATYAENLIEMKIIEDKCKESVKITMAEVYADMKNNFASYGLKKAPTDPTTKSMTEMNEIVLEKQAELREAKFTVEVLKASVEAIHVKKSSLENLVKLKVMTYHSTPIVEGMTKEIRDDMRRDLING